MGGSLSLVSVRFLAGSVYGVPGRTALFELGTKGPIPDSVPEMLADAGIPASLNAADPWPLPAEGDWTAPFLSAGAGDGPLADTVAALLAVIQIWARDPVDQARVIPAPEGRIRLAMPWYRQAVARAAAAFVAGYVSSLSEGDAEFDASDRLATLLARAQPGGLSPNSLRFALAARRRDMPVTVLNGAELMIGWGANARRFRSSFTDRSATLGERLARNKRHCNLRLAGGRLPVPRQRVVATVAAAREAASEFGWPVVVKPVGLDQGQGVHAGISSAGALETAFQAVSAIGGGGVLVEAFVPGADHRLLIADGELVMASRRIPGGVIGDGAATVAELLERLNADPRRGTGLRSTLIRIPLDAEAMQCLAAEGLAPDTVPEAGRFVALRRTANISTGGTAEDVTDRVHPDNRVAAIRAARIIGLDIAGVDFLCPDISVSHLEGGGAICEVNGQPGFRPHWLSDPDRDVNGEILDILFRGRPARIPTAAVSGTNGKSTTARMLHHVWQVAGRTAGACTTAGTWIGTDRVDTQNMSGAPGAAMLFADPGVEAAVLEVPRLGLIRFGNACDRYDVAAFTNVHEEHLGRDGIETLEQMAELKARVIHRAREAVVINAGDPLCIEASRGARARRMILVALSRDIPALAAHLAQGGSGVFVDGHDGEEWIVSARGDSRHPFMRVADIPATMGGLLRFNVLNAMFAASLADAQGVAASTIRAALGSFAATRELSPGRYNMVEGLPFRLLIDYAHTPEAVRELCRVVRELDVPGRRLLALQTLGNSGPGKLVASAAELAGTFDRITVMADLKYIRKYSGYTGDDPVGQMLAASRDIFRKAGVADAHISTGRDDEAQVDALLTRAGPEDLVVMMVGADAAYRHVDRFRAGLRVRRR